MEDALFECLVSVRATRYSCLTYLKGIVVLLIVMNQNNHNAWIWRPFLAAEIFWVQHLTWDYGVEFHQEGNKIEATLWPLPMADIMASVKVVHNEPHKVPAKEEASPEPHPTFGAHPNTQAANFDFKIEVEHLLFKLNLGDVPFEKEHQTKFIDLIYSNQEVFSSHDEDLGYCDQLTHTISTSTSKPVHLLHRIILRQLQGEVCKCSNTWVCQGIIHPSNSPYASQVVLVCRNLGIFVSVWIIGN